MLENLLKDLMAFNSGEMPVLTATLDLRPGTLGGRPPAPTIAKQAVSDEVGPGEYRSAAATASLEADEERLQASIEAGIREGASGLLYVGCAGEDFSREVLLGEPLRNSVRVGNAPWILELARFRSVYGTSATVVFVDLHTMNALRIRAGDAVPVATVDYDAHALTKKAGRTNVEGHSMGAGGAGGGFTGGPAGGHSKNKVENKVEEHRAMFAREAAAELGKEIGPDDVFIIAGVTEARSQLLAELPPDLARTAIELPAAENIPGSTGALTRLAMDYVVQQHYDSSAALLDGRGPDEVVTGRPAILAELREGRIGSLIIHEDAVGHLGFSDDARAQGVRDGEDEVELAVRLALDTSADIRFTGAPGILAEQQGMLALRRW